MLAPWLQNVYPWLYGLFLFIWGLAAAGDSPQFSTLVANRAPVAARGSVITLVVSIGFLLTVLSIQTMAWLVAQRGASAWLFYLLLPGPVLGIWANRSERDARNPTSSGDLPDGGTTGVSTLNTPS